MKEIKGTSRVCGLIGNPVEHSISPLIHNTLADLKKIDMVYTCFKVEKDELKEASLGAFALDVLGLNVTVPHKENVMEALVDVDPIAKAIGAVNTLVRKSNGFKGYNTDILGLERELEDENIKLENSTCIILGAGGAARAIAFLLASRQAKKIYILNRSQDRAKSIKVAVADYLKKDIIEVLALDEFTKIKEKDCLCIQATSLGLYPNCEEVVIDNDDFYEKIGIGVDIIYNPETTKFMKLCMKHGKKAYNGLKMLLYQGISAFELWTNTKVSKEEASIVYNKMKAKMAGNIILIGFMGAGKTTLAKWMAKNKNMTFIDTDELIEKQENRPIKEIFAKEGENYFRDLETKTIKELARTAKNSVISVGGGLVLREENVKILRSMGEIVFLETSKHELLKRLSDSKDRPLLQGVDLSKKIDELMEAREDIYLRAATIKVNTNDRDMERIYKEIVS